MGTTLAAVEHTEKDIKISNFKRNAVYQEDISTGTIKYFKIESEDTPGMTFNESKNDCYPGAPGDILCSVQQNCIAPILNELISFYAGGHAGYVTGDFRDYEINANQNSVLESTMTNGPDTVAKLFPKREWMSTEFFTEVIGLRVSMTPKQYQEVTSVIMSYMDDPYNKSFFFNTTNSSYCSDLMSKAYSYIGKDLNRDGFTTSIYDLIVSSDTYISYYHYFDSQGVKYVYYLG